MRVKPGAETPTSTSGGSEGHFEKQEQREKAESHAAQAQSPCLLGNVLSREIPWDPKGEWQEKEVEVLGSVPRCCCWGKPRQGEVPGEGGWRRETPASPFNHSPSATRENSSHVISSNVVFLFLKTLKYYFYPEHIFFFPRNKRITPTCSSLATWEKAGLRFTHWGHSTQVPPSAHPQ